MRLQRDVQNFIDVNANPTLEDEGIRQSSTSRDTQGFNDDMTNVPDNDNPTLQDHVLEDPYDFVFVGNPKTHRVLNCKDKCGSCGAIRLFCCMNGKTKWPPTSIHVKLYNIFTANTDRNDTCIQHQLFIRINVCNFDKSMANMTSGVYTFHVSGGIYYRIDQLVPRNGKPTHLQLYFYDSENEMSHRLKLPNLDKEIVKTLTRVLASNPYVATFRSFVELGSLDNYIVTLNASVDERDNNRPTTSEVLVSVLKVMTT
ncbi:hypothetical protein LXL04_028489 [Taraxacum kok-saghyz]